MNWQAVKAIYFFEMARFFRTLTQSFVSPVISTRISARRHSSMPSSS